MAGKLPEGEKEMIQSVCSFFQLERARGQRLQWSKVVQRTAKACGVSERTVKRCRMNQKRVARKSMKKNQIIELVWLKLDTIQQSGSNFLNLNDIHEIYVSKKIY